MSGYTHQHPEATIPPLTVPPGEARGWAFPDPIPVPLPPEMALEIVAGELMLLREIHQEYQCVLQRIAECLRDVMGNRAGS